MRPPRWTFAEWEQATLVLLRRDGGRCPACGVALRGEGVRHHRMRRREGGDRLSNVVLLHDACHRQVHAQPVDSRERGLIVPTWSDPLTWPLDVPGRGRFLLDDDGGRSPFV